MKVTAIDSGKIEAMMVQLKAAAQKHSTGNIDGGMDSIGLPSAISQPAGTGKVSFADALKSSLNQVNKAQSEADTLGKRFAMGDDKVNLSDVMVSMQKASISFQATVQVRNKVIAAYNDIMNMQI